MKDKNIEGANKQWCLGQAIEIIKEYGDGGADAAKAANDLDRVYKKLCEIGEDIWKEEK